MSATVYKITLLGGGAVGKTALRDSFMGKPFSADYHMTIGADIAFKSTTIDQREIQFQIWDLAGQPRFELVQPAYYRGSLGSLILFDLARPDTLDQVLDWVGRLWKFSGKGKVPIILLGNKVDLRKSVATALQPDKGKAIAADLSKKSQTAGFEVPYLETSAKTGKNVEEAFVLLANAIREFIQFQLEHSK
ncbi:MAG: GTP-binding protein [Candidatus Heimdallarchaeota archaeon]